MKILMLSNGLRLGGKERRLVELLKGLSEKNDFECHLCLLKDDVHYNEIYDLNIIFHLIKRKNKKDLSVYLKLYKICKEIKPDIIQSWDSLSSIFVIPIVCLLKTKFICSLTTTPLKLTVFSKLGILSKISFEIANVIVSNSKAGFDKFNAPPSKGIIIKNGFDFKRLENIESDETIKNELGIQEKKVIGMVGTLDFRKDFSRFINIGLEILTKRTDVVFLIIGDGVNKQKVINIIPSEHKNSFLFLGKKNDVEKYIELFYIGVLITNNKMVNEGISNAIMEYMALSKPVVANESGGTSEIIEDGKTGYIIWDDSNTLFVEKIMYLLDNQEIANILGKHGKERIMKEFTFSQMVENYSHLYKKIINNN